MKWLRVRLRAKRIKRITESRLRELYMINLEPTDDNEQQADLITQFEMKRRKVTSQDIKLVREARRVGVVDWQELEERLESTRIQRILGWEIDS
jgi:hypothetical protein